MAKQLSRSPISGSGPPTTMKLEGSLLHDQANAKVESPAASISKSTAAHDALSITELLEQILSHLSVEDLMLLRRVSRHWRDTMAGSLVLRRAMFLAPEPELPFEWHLQWICLGQVHWHYIQKPSGTASKPGETVLQSSRFNPLLFERRLDFDSEGVGEGQESVRLHARNDVFIAGGNNLFTQMFIAQPPVTHARVASTILIELHNENGIRVADIIEALRHNFDSYGLHRNTLSIVIPKVMFPTADEEKQGLIVRPSRSLRALYHIRADFAFTW